ncbi:MAG: tryptophan--tRNA ligase [Eubacteriales bacterium]|nr:tryptophan--tRNA ligase [Eubacteriales bacterium]
MDQQKTNKKPVVVSGARPTGDIHLGNYAGAVANWIALQDDYDCHYFIADYHALTTHYQDTSELRDLTLRVAADYIACGIDPDKVILFLQSSVPEHAELSLLLSMLTPVSWLERNPSYKDLVNELSKLEIRTLGFLGYPCLMAADVLMYRANFVPVGEDQLPHLELAWEIARRFNHLYGITFPEPAALLTKSKVLPGTDGRKMSKSYNNTISFADAPEEVQKKVMCMVTDPARIHKTDPGHPEICSVFSMHKEFNVEDSEEIARLCRAGEIGCVACKRRCGAAIAKFHTPIHEKRTALLAQPSQLIERLQEGSKVAQKKAKNMIAVAREAIKIGF